MRPIESVYSDAVSPIRTESLDKSTYFVTLFDEYSGYSMVNFLQYKCETASAMTEMTPELENLFNERVGTLSHVNQNTVKWIQLEGGKGYIRHSFQK